jgi:hypothetical protein
MDKRRSTGTPRRDNVINLLDYMQQPAGDTYGRTQAEIDGYVVLEVETAAKPMAGLGMPDADQRAEIAFMAACELSRFFKQLRASTEADDAGGEPRPIPPAVMHSAARRGFDLANIITCALTDSGVRTADLELRLESGALHHV